MGEISGSKFHYDDYTKTEPQALTQGSFHYWEILLTVLIKVVSLDCDFQVPV